MLPKKNRLTYSEFNRIFQKPKQYATLFFFVKIKNNPTNQNPKLAVIVPKKLDKRSTKRHFTKRIVLEIIKNKIKNIPVSFNVLIKAQKIINKTNIKTAIQDLEGLLDKAKAK